MSDGRDSINKSLQMRAKAHRLPTLQPVRDLTMGAKKVFVPNLNAKKTHEPEAPKQEVKKEKPDRVHKKREPRAPRGDKKHYQKKEYVQSYSIFADGAAATSNLARDAKGVRFGDGGGSGGGGGGGGPRGIRLGGPKSGGGGVSDVSDGLGKLSVKKEEGGGDPFISDLEGGYLQPVVYPRNEPFQPRPPPSEFFLREPDDDEYEELALIQMVHPMPVCPTSPEIDPRKDPSESVDFASLPDGEMARLQVLDTGEVRLVIGNRGASLDVFQGTPVQHLMEVVRVRQLSDAGPDASGVDGEEEDEENAMRDRTGEMSVLGRIQNRFVCSVNFDDVFDDMAAERDARGQDSDSDTDEAR